MEITFQEALNQINTATPGAVFKVVNQARPSEDYVLARLLPEVLHDEYYVTSGDFIVRSTMAMPTAMDSPFPESGVVETRQFSSEAFKFSNQVTLSEKSLRQIQAMSQRLTMTNGADGALRQLVTEVLNFSNKLLAQSHIDTLEWMRGQALTKGALDWKYNGIWVKVDYGIPDANKLTARTGNDKYGGSASKFWADVKAAQKLLKRNVYAFLVNPNTFEEIIGNEVNATVDVSGSIENGDVTLQRKTGGSATADTLERSSAFRIRLIIVRGEGEILDPANAGKTILKPFLEDGYMVAVGNNTANGYIVGEGSTPLPNQILGYTHLAPTTEGNGVPGRWGRVYTPEGMPWALRGQGVTVGVPVLQSPEKIVICKTDMS